MSSKTKTTATKDDATPALVPKLRFPEFRGAEVWKGVPLSELVGALDAGVSVNSGDRPATRNEVGVLKTSAVTNGVFEPQENKVVFDELERGRLKEPVQGGTIIISRMNTPALVGANAYVETSLENIYLPDRLWAAKAKPGTSMRFLASLLGSDKGRAALSKLAKGSSGSMKNITKPDVLAFVVVAPSPAEQQKIAECLSSVDELMAAQARKVDALKTHKNGLMQQLFPREGETQPRLRFPEFENAGEWNRKPLGGLCRIRTGKKDANEGAADGVYPFFTCAEKHIFSHNYSFDAEAILIAGNANVGQTSYYNGKFEAYQRTYVLTDFKGIFVPYLYSVLSANLRPDLLAQVQTSAMSYIRLPMLEEYQINAPSSQAEQQRIATCLSSLDALITAETQKLEALKTHKKGLMQQLFPSPEDVEE